VVKWMGWPLCCRPRTALGCIPSSSTMWQACREFCRRLLMLFRGRRR
jgi:hypothetical protein